MATSEWTQDHDFIRNWVEERGGRPAHVKTTAKGDEIGILRIDFPSPPDPDDEKDANLEAISWDEFFEKFDENDLVFLYQEETAEGQKSNFNKLVKRETVEARADESASKGKAKSKSKKK
jgi:hypothetical protein